MNSLTACIKRVSINLIESMSEGKLRPHYLRRYGFDTDATSTV